jgi:multiple antibiotic resistance protein
MENHVVDFFGVLSLAFVGLFPVVNPVGDAPIFLSLTRHYPQSTQRILAKRIAAYGFALLASSLIFGSTILAFFGITLGIMQIAGGLVVTSTGWTLLNQQEQEPVEKNVPDTVEDALQHAFFPLTLPITVGPGCISIAITIGAHLRSREQGLGHGGIRNFVAALTGMFLVCLLVAVCYGNAGRLVQLLGKSGTSILTRLSAFVLLAIGVQIIWNGLVSVAPQLLGSR